VTSSLSLSLHNEIDGSVAYVFCFLMQILKVDPNTGEVICSLTIRAQVDNLAFGRCPNEFNGKLNCLYGTSTSYGERSPTLYDGALLLIRGLETEGVLPYPLKLENIISKRKFDHKCESERLQNK
jgi:hypothetical protein